MEGLGQGAFHSQEGPRVKELRQVVLSSLPGLGLGKGVVGGGGSPWL